MGMAQGKYYKLMIRWVGSINIKKYNYGMKSLKEVRDEQ